MSLRRKQNLSGTVSGFTLVEVMVALLVLAIGLLGLAGLLLAGLSSNHNAYVRTQATLLAQDMADRMRNNRGNLAAYSGGATTDDCSANSCTGAQMAGYDLAQWNQALAALLPGGAGVIANNPAGSAVYEISITWNEHVSNPDPTQAVVQKEFDMSFQP